MKPNKEKCYLWVSGYKHENVWASIEQMKIWESAKPKLLGAEIDRSLINMFDHYVRKLEKRKKLLLWSWYSLVEQCINKLTTNMKGLYELFTRISSYYLLVTKLH